MTQVSPNEQKGDNLLVPRRILHVLDHSQPHRSGYAIRSDSILQFQRRLGFDPVVLTSTKHGKAPREREEIGEIVYHRTDPVTEGLEGQLEKIPFLRERRQIRTMRRRIEDVAQAEHAELIHAHSPSLNGIPAYAVARRLGLPFVYEVRAFWEDAAVDHGTFKQDSFKYNISRMIETRVFRRADAVTVICEGLRDELVGRGIDAEKIFVIPNGVDLERFTPRQPKTTLIEKYGLENRDVIGFLGSFYRYEGLSLLLDAFANLRETAPNARLLLVGGGEEEADLRAKAESLGLGSTVIFTGSVPPDQVLDLYSIVDILVYPRMSMRLTDTVTPLKPLEAMSMGKVVVASDVGGLKELVRDGESGLLFPAGDSAALVRTLCQAIDSRAQWPAMGERARRHVMETRRWEDIIARYQVVYRNAQESAARDGRLGRPDGKGQ
ncbi:TIGR04063 family PEP-CTERM/XrtA system glycosyltransferase [Singulisphaera acidiphila]|uniref:PEP-CTERM/exosortase 1-associated glycosyltransferase, Daro_2409 family n=1 Tax=Singulisphaera acidiphila (strain ATCC BAA-1392 / DSM 18658 / VKM B-2454 / MOB10) TaxID=886293 RepID=L0DK25_SINAD|nr:TIGR04063 family PEP-CTERM/XrtA system glycosyltransferase [Singulisphaera acidiphila]AGA29607.1 PEP-CTERM/exosortase 1-associated glycosyltransferase, Daro_2409 family [Singulisphaera acidiphila DSM 18658]